MRIATGCMDVCPAMLPKMHRGTRGATYALKIPFIKSFCVVEMIKRLPPLCESGPMLLSGV